MKIKLKSEEELKEFFSYINTINQDWKNFKYNGIYTMALGELFAMGQDTDDSVSFYGTLNTSKLKFTEDFFMGLDTVMDGIGLFRFIKDHKKDITVVMNLNGNLILKTGAGLRFDSIKNETLVDTDEDLYYSFMKRITGEKKNKVKVKDHVISKETIADIIKLPFGTKYKVNKKFSLYLSRSVVNPIKGADLKLRIVEMTNYPGLYLVKYSSIKQKYKLDSFYVITS